MTEGLSEEQNLHRPARPVIAAGVATSEEGRVSRRLLRIVPAPLRNRLYELPWVHSAYFSVRDLVIDDPRARRLFVELGPLLDFEFEGFHMLLDLEVPQERAFLRNVFRSGVGLYERETSLAIRNRLRIGETFIDVGSNSGYYALLAASKLAGTGLVIAIEPSPATYRRLVSNVELNHFQTSVRTVCAAASDAEGTTQFYLSPVRDSLNSTTRRKGSLELVVQTKRVDSLCLSPPTRFTCKIDAEGSEVSVLRGMAGLFSPEADYAIAIEWNATERYASRTLWDELTRLGSIFRLMPKGNGSYDTRRVREFADLKHVGLTNLWVQSVET